MLSAPALRESFPDVPTNVEPAVELENQCVDLPLATRVSAGGDTTAVVLSGAVLVLVGEKTTLAAVIAERLTPFNVSVSPPPSDTTVSEPDCFIAAANELKSVNP